MTESTEDLEGLKQAFALFDRDRDGEINKDELAKVSLDIVNTASISYH